MYREKVQSYIEKENLKKLWEDICNAYEQGGVKQIKLFLDRRISYLKKDYQKVLKKLENML